jgi:queuine tRNA-ribosyltransferase
LRNEALWTLKNVTFTKLLCYLKHVNFRVDFEEIIPPDLPGNGAARRGRIKTSHGEIETPIFMPVGTQGTVKGVFPWDLKSMGAQIILGNTYHLWLRPGIEALRTLGGLRNWMKWSGPLLTDSGGFQVFSLSALRKLSDQGVEFRSHLDGTKLFMSPETSIEIQEAVGSTIMMVLDVCPALPASDQELSEALRLSTLWAERCLKIRRPDSGALFAIIQGGLDPRKRKQHLDEILSLDVRDQIGDQRVAFDGYALGGFSVGEEPEDMYPVISEIAGQLPRQHPRYLMGVGTPTDLLYGIRSGIDMFDCVLPSRNARHGVLYTWKGAVHIKNKSLELQKEAVDENCECPACRNFSASYLRHLFRAGEMLGPMLGTLHNLHFFLDLMKKSREAISEKRFEAFMQKCLNDWRPIDAVLKL